MKRDDTPFFHLPLIRTCAPFCCRLSRLDLCAVTTTESTLKSCLVRRKGGEGGIMGEERAPLQRVTRRSRVGIHFERSNIYWRARNIAIFFSPNILQSFYFLISVKLIVIEKGRFLTNNEKISQIFPSTKVIRLSL